MQQVATQLESSDKSLLRSLASTLLQLLGVVI
jgi:hypothetical protein